MITKSTHAHWSHDSTCTGHMRYTCICACTLTSLSIQTAPGSCAQVAVIIMLTVEDQISNCCAFLVLQCLFRNFAATLLPLQFLAVMSDPQAAQGFRIGGNMPCSASVKYIAIYSWGSPTHQCSLDLAHGDMSRLVYS